MEKNHISALMVYINSGSLAKPSIGQTTSGALYLFVPIQPVREKESNFLEMLKSASLIFSSIIFPL